MRVALRSLCQARSGDKADSSDVTIFAPNREIYDVLLRELTPERVKAHFRGLARGDVTRYEIPNVLAIKFLLDEALGGGAASSLRIDNLGKAMGSAMLRMEVDVPEGLLRDPTLPARSPHGRVGLPELLERADWGGA